MMRLPLPTQFKVLREKQDSLLESSKTSSSLDYSIAAHKALLQTMMKDHATNLEQVKKVVADSSTVCKDTTEKVDKLVSNVQTFMGNFQTSFEANTAKANKVITSLGTTLRSKKAAIENIHIGNQTDNTEFQSSISAKIEKLQDDLVMENKIMDELAVKTEKLKVMYVKLTHTNQHIDELKSEKVVIKSCMDNINLYLHNLIETRDSLLTVFFHQHLIEKLKPIFSMLDHIVGASRYSIPKQGENL